MSRFEGRVAYITGASGGIGAAIGQALAAEGASLFLTGRNEDRLTQAAEEARATGATVETFLGDLTDDELLRRSVVGVRERFGRVDLLIHSAGYFHMGTIETASVEELDRQYRINLRLPYLLTQQLIPALRESRGEIVLINSTSGLRMMRGGASAYGATKFGLRAFADSLRDEVNDAGVRVLSVFPGRTASLMQERVRELEELPYTPERLLQPEEVASAILQAISMPRTAEMTDLMIRPHLK